MIFIVCEAISTVLSGWLCAQSIKTAIRKYRIEQRYGERLPFWQSYRFDIFIATAWGSSSVISMLNLIMRGILDAS